MKSIKHLGFTRMLQIVKGDSEQEVYLCQISKKDHRDMLKEDLKKIPDTDEIFEMELFDLISMSPDKPFEPQFTLTSYINSDFALNNRLYQQTLFLNDSLEVLGPLLHGERQNFGFIRSNKKEESPITP